MDMHRNGVADDDIDFSPPKALNLNTEVPQAKSAYSQKARLLMSGLGILALSGVFWGYYHRAHKEEAQVKAHTENTTAAEEAVSNRKDVQGAANPPKSTFRTVDSVYTHPNTTNPAAASGQSDSTSSHPQFTYTPANGQATQPATPAISRYEQAQIDFENDRLKRERSARGARIDSEGDPGKNQQPAQPGVPPGITMPSESTPSAPGGIQDYAAALSSALHPNGDGPSSRLNESGYTAQNEQEEKRNFAKDEDASPYLVAARTAPISPFQIMQGEHIPVTLDPNLNSDLPGNVTAIVRRDVHDSKTGKYVLIPAGTRALGTYNTNLSYGQNRVQVAWNRLIYPDMTSQSLGKMMAYSSDGSSGLHDRVNNHWTRVIAGLGMTSLLSAGLSISQNHSGSNSTFAYPTPGQDVATAIGQQSQALGQQLASRNLNIQATINIRPGQVFYIDLSKDMVFDGPYTPRN